MTALVLADHDNVSVLPSTRNAITAALQMDPDVHVVVSGNECGGVADAIAKIEGVTKIIVAQHAGLAHHLPENVAALLLDLAPAYGHIVAPATSVGKNALPRVAALLDIAQVSDISAVRSADTFERPIYAGNATAVVRSSAVKKVVTVRTTKFTPAADGQATAEVVSVEFSGNTDLSRYISSNVTVVNRPELTTASVVVSGGRGMGSEEKFALLFPVAEKLNAAVGASRAAVDAGFAPSDSQVGQTGKVVAPKVYLAVGISGAIQHLAGMKDSKLIFAINKDPEAPIFQVADVGLVGDLFEILPKLSAGL